MATRACMVYLSRRLEVLLPLVGIMNADVYRRPKTSALKDIHILIPQIYEYISFCGRSISADVAKLMLLKWKIILDYSGRPNLITRVFKNKRGKSKAERNLNMLCCWLWRWRKETPAKHHRWPLAAQKRKETSPTEIALDFNTLILAQ